MLKDMAEYKSPIHALPIHVDSGLSSFSNCVFLRFTQEKGDVMHTSGPRHLATLLDHPSLAGELESRFSHREQAPVLRAEVGTVEAG